MDGFPSVFVTAAGGYACATALFAEAFGRRRDAGVILVLGLTTLLPQTLALAVPQRLIADALAVATAGAVLHMHARAYLAGRRDEIGIVVGAGFLLVTLLGETTRALGVLAGPSLAPLGFVALVMGITTRLFSHHRGTARELTSRRGELAMRTRELEKSNVALRHAREQLVQKEQLATVGERAAVIAHEVRNPLGIIANAVSNLRKATVTEPARADLLGILDDETTRLNRIVTDLLRYARPLTVQRARIAVNELLERALQLVEKGEGIKVELHVEARDARVWADPNLLRQAFDNLVGNAVQAMESEGTLTVRIRSATVDGEERLAVDIVDTGEGMDTAVRKRAKDPFFTTRPAGTGLGLAIVDRIIAAHGGQLEISSRAGEGTRVTVLLPWGSPSEPP